jgi:excisionase family DNA binding protein
MLDDDDGSLTIREFCEWAKVGRTLTYQLINEGTIEAFKVGTKTLVTKSSARKWRASLPRINSSALTREAA